MGEWRRAKTEVSPRSAADAHVVNRQPRINAAVSVFQDITSRNE